MKGYLFSFQLSLLTDLVKLTDLTYHCLSDSSQMESRTLDSRSNTECDRISAESCLGYSIRNWRITPRFSHVLRSAGPPRMSSLCRINARRRVLAGKVKSTFWKALFFSVSLNIWFVLATLHIRWPFSRLTLDKCCTWSRFVRDFRPPFINFSESALIQISSTTECVIDFVQQSGMVVFESLWTTF